MVMKCTAWPRRARNLPSSEARMPLPPTVGWQVMPIFRGRPFMSGEPFEAERGRVGDFRELLAPERLGVPAADALAEEARPHFHRVQERGGGEVGLSGVAPGGRVVELAFIAADRPQLP